MAEKKKRQKIVYLSNSRDYTNQKNVNESSHFKSINELLDDGWTVAQLVTGITVSRAVMNAAPLEENTETFAALVVLEKDVEE